MILQEYESGPDPKAGHRHLLLRKLTAAAAVLLLVGFMTIVVVNILTPAKEAEQFALDDVKNKYIDSVKLAPEQDYTLLADSVEYKLFYAELTVEVLDVVSMNEYLQKVFYDNDLIDSTVPIRNPQFSRYVIKADKQRVNMLLSDLDRVWDKFHDVRLTIFGDRPDSSLILPNAEVEDISAILNNNADKDYVQIARDYARNKELYDSLPGRDIVELAYDVATSRPEPVRPSLASVQAGTGKAVSGEQSKVGADIERKPAIKNVKIIITVVGM
jgi:hypothetical protein